MSNSAEVYKITHTAEASSDLKRILNRLKLCDSGNYAYHGSVERVEDIARHRNFFESRGLVVVGRFVDQTGAAIIFRKEERRQ